MSFNKFIDFSAHVDTSTIKKFEEKDKEIERNISEQGDTTVDINNESSNLYLDDDETSKNNMNSDYRINHSKEASDLSSNSDTRFQRKKACCCLTRIVLIWVTVILLMFGLIYAIVIVVCIQNCDHLSKHIDSIEPEIISYDPNLYTNFTIEDFNNVKEGEIVVSQSVVPNDNNATLSIRLATLTYTKAYMKSEFQDSTFILQILRESFPNSKKLAWLGYLSIPPKCVVARLELTLPQFTKNATTLINSNRFKTNFTQNLVPYTSPIHLETSDGDISFENNLLANQLSIVTQGGNINGNLIQSKQNDINIETHNGKITINLDIKGDKNLVNQGQSNVKVTTSKGDINLGISIEKDIKSPNVEINSIHSDISVGFNNSFNGHYEIKSAGKIKVVNNLEITSKTNGEIGDFNNEELSGVVNIRSKNGDVDAKF
ncbi:8541_t:CDS:2 [Funneliformis geosporum]|uniref:8541_t:CDS:1 n=1 Tax=Funneliformis geosporum TaxID=1117311 RepID=A0A9W4WKK1_9GLOM|nr:8541_t:CDS:2 [Funneliformis geosporum]